MALKGDELLSRAGGEGPPPTIPVRKRRKRGKKVTPASARALAAAEKRASEQPVKKDTALPTPIVRRGPRGDKGTRGEKGDEGEPGTPGTPGRDGETQIGERGEQGPPGDPGQGFPGRPGDKGIEGDPGRPGDSGTKGDTGDKGESGDQGPKGDDGDKGDAGDTGPEGRVGDRGRAGDKGGSGDKGDKGPPGRPGDKGDRGPSGKDAHVKGDKGAKGDQGDRGFDGAQGTSGKDGKIGRDGDDGRQGDSGKKGDKGDKGDRGKKGAKGDRGPVDVISVGRGGGGFVVKGKPQTDDLIIRLSSQRWGLIAKAELGGGTAADTVESETAFGAVAAAGVAATYSRGDHTHGSPTDPVTAHVALPDAHHVAFVQGDADLLYDALGGLATHAALASPHHVEFVQGDADLLYDALGGLATHAGLASPHHASFVAADADLLYEALGGIATHAALGNAHHVEFVQADADLLYDVLGGLATHAGLASPHHTEWTATEHTAVGDGAPHHAAAHDYDIHAGGVPYGDLEFDDATSDPLDCSLTDTALDGTEGSAARKDHVHAFSAPRVRAYHSVNQATTSGVFFDIAYDGTSYDSEGDMHHDSVNNDRLYARVAGVYIISLFIDWQTVAAAGRAVIDVYLNGRATGVLIGRIDHKAGITEPIGQTMTLVYEMAEDEYVTSAGWQDTGLGRNINAWQDATKDWSPIFSLTWIGPAT